ncbi:Tripartite-type tricarboxylate transporter, receptor component TctC [Noviherbaspirillum humi]|uniref:Tripartite-type tricarboxylate transporter, receptor component TctC n=1 Tax=Noviherbaspirillum humi TaxID=1688639 RepID=A0A239L0X7_9BURK|nr:tripartite tricarboxylate transporter substrate binding protein [Noviherbaspirillum humi]SNT23965.1 Tripartite-type tricarboxylate transporter, receptor component TctC [Noviherbaspirillum humi]
MNNLRRLTLATCIAVSLAAFTTQAAFAQTTDYPKKPIKIVVPFPAGGTSDVIARMVGQKLTEAWGQPVIIDNRAGANGNIGADLVAKSEPDGYTLVLMDMGNLTLSPTLYPKLPFNPLKDLAPVTMLAFSPHILVTTNSLPVKSQSELVAYSKANKGRLNFAAAAGTGSAAHLAGVLFAQKTGAEWGYIPYKGGAQALTDLISGQVDVTMNGMVATYPHVKAGKIHLLAVASSKRLPQLPDVPTVSEMIPGFVTGSWQGVMAPAGTPRAVINKLNAEMARIVRMPDVREKLAAQGAEVQTGSPEEFGAWMKTEVANWAKVINDAKIKLD